MNANIDLLSTACIRRKRPQKSGDREGHSALADKRRKGASVSSSAAIEQIFHETLNKRRDKNIIRSLRVDSGSIPTPP